MPSAVVECALNSASCPVCYSELLHADMCWAQPGRPAKPWCPGSAGCDGMKSCTLLLQQTSEETSEEFREGFRGRVVLVQRMAFSPTNRNRAKNMFCQYNLHFYTGISKGWSINSVWELLFVNNFWLHFSQEPCWWVLQCHSEPLFRSLLLWGLQRWVVEWCSSIA